MAIANANYEFMYSYIDVGMNVRISDGGVITNTQFYEKISQGSLKIPSPEEPNLSDTVLPYVFVGDEAFSLRPDCMKPYQTSFYPKIQESLTIGYPGSDE